jgi:hypothetical protein
MTMDWGACGDGLVARAGVYLALSPIQPVVAVGRRWIVDRRVTMANDSSVLRSSSYRLSGGGRLVARWRFDGECEYLGVLALINRA